MARLYKFYKIIFIPLAKNILIIILFASPLKPAFGVVGKVTNITEKLAQGKTDDSKSSIKTVEIPPSVFSDLLGIEKPKSPAILKLDGSKMDLSPVIQILEQVKKSHHDNYWEMKKIDKDIFSKIKYLCKTLPENENKRRCVREALQKIDDFYKNMEEEMSERILYPLWYSNAKYNIESSFKEAINLLDSDCRSSCSDRTVVSEILFSSKVQYSQLYDKIKRKNKSCQKAALSHLAKKLTNIRFPKKCLQKENKNHPVCKDVLEYVNTTARERFRSLIELAYGPKALNNTEAKAPCFDCAIKDDREVNELFDFMKTLEEQSQCFELNHGEEKPVHPGTGLDMFGSYTVRKESDDAYSVALNLKFSADEDYDGEVPKDQVPQEYLKKTQRCIRKANEGILGPNGEKLRIAIKEPLKTDTCKEVNTIQIRIGSEDMRSNASKYESDINCPVITHEVLHLLGLCDEYKESVIGSYVNSKTGDIKHSSSLDNDEKKRLAADEGYVFKPAFDCRVIQDNNNVMVNQDKRWEFVFGINEDQETGHSLLTPGQFNSILYGGCSQKNQLFNECSFLAYASSDKIPGCMERKERCESQNIQGLDKQEEIERLKKRIEFHAKIRDHLNKQVAFIKDGGRLSGFKPEVSASSLSPDSRSKSTNTLAPPAEVLGDRSQKKALDFLNMNIDFQNRDIDDLKRRLKGVKSWPDP